MGTSLCIPQTIRIPRDSSGVLVISLDLPQSTHIIPSGYQIDGEDNRKDPKRSENQWSVNARSGAYWLLNC